ncbi:MAG: HAD-IB family phosphatase [Firmicutes bacterium]|nr:HAD-IB family phosphatase [Bacillota bacterium]
MKQVFFLDFDGTVTKDDVVATMVKKFCRPGWKELNDQWERGELSTEQVANKTFQLFDATITDIYRLLDTIELDDYFADFVQLCNDKNYSIYILSDGYGLLIKYILQRHGLGDLVVYANELVADNSGYSISCTHLNDQCGKCGTCKKTLLHKLKEKSTLAVYAGDGYSDTCVCHEADVVFAKNSLLSYCQDKNVPAIPYTSFKDIIQWIKKRPTNC